MITRNITYEVLDGPFFYLAGPMTDMPNHNFHEFLRIEKKLTDIGYAIVSPYDLKSQPAPNEGGNPPDSDSPAGLEMLRRDLNIVMDPNCVGIIVIPGWEDSFGADVETFVGDKWGRLLYAYEDLPMGAMRLTQIANRDEALAAHRRSKPAREFFSKTTMQGRTAGILEALDSLGKLPKRWTP